MCIMCMSIVYHVYHVYHVYLLVSRFESCGASVMSGSAGLSLMPKTNLQLNVRLQSPCAMCISLQGPHQISALRRKIPSFQAPCDSG